MTASPAAHGTGQQYQQWRIRQLIDSCINIILPSRIPVIYFILFYCKSASGFTEVLSVNEPESEHVTSNCCCCMSELIVTHCSPGGVVIHFKTSFVWTGTSNQSHCKRQLRRLNHSLLTIKQITILHFWSYSLIWYQIVIKMRLLITLCTFG